MRISHAIAIFAGLFTFPADVAGQPTGREGASVQDQSSAAAAVPGRAPRSTVGIAGERQTREEAAPNIRPAARVNGRIANRVQNRLRTRIDRAYNPQANATDPFAVAEDQAQGQRPDR